MRQDIISISKERILRNLLDNTLAQVVVEKPNNIQQLLSTLPPYNGKTVIFPSMIEEIEFKIECKKEEINPYSRRSYASFVAKQDGCHNILCYPSLHEVKAKLPEIIHGKILSHEKREFPAFEGQEILRNERNIDIEVALRLKEGEKQQIRGFVDPIVYILTQDNEVQECIFGANYANIFMRGGKSLDEIEKIIRSEDFPKSFIESRGLEVHKIYGVRYDPNFPMGNSFKFNLSYFEGNYEEKGEAELKAFFEAHSKLGDSLLFTGERRENKFVIDGIFDKDQNNFFNTYLFEHPPKLKRED